MTQIQTAKKLVTFEEFIQWYPENSQVRYELHDGIIIEMAKPTGDHSEIAGFLIAQLNFEFINRKLPYLIPRECVVKTEKSSYEPDVIVLDKIAIKSESRWKKESAIEKGSSVRLVVEVVSTNWEDDYARKLDDYEEIGIPEYWIVDYLGLGGRKFIGNPKRPTLSVYRLIDREYQVSQFRDHDRIVSPTFPDLNLTANQIFQAGEIE